MKPSTTDWKNKRLPWLKTYKNLIYTVAAAAVFLAFWKLASVVVAKEILVPSPETTICSLAELVRQGYFWEAVSRTLQRTLAGFGLALAAALVTGTAAGFIKPLNIFFRPFNVIIKAMPTMSVILLAIIWLNSERAPLLVGFLVIFPILYGNVIEGINNIDEKLLEMAKMFRIRRRRVLTGLYLPSIGSYLFAASTTALGLNLKVMISAEVLSQPKFAIGTELQMEKAFLNTANVFAWTIAVIILVALFDFILKILRSLTDKKRSKAADKSLLTTGCSNNTINT